MPQHLFTYGTLMVPSIWQRFVRRQTASAPALLQGYSRRRIMGDSYPVLVPAPQKETVQGLLYLNLTPKELIRLDRYEGEYYYRKRAPVRLMNGKSRIAEVYLLKPRYRHLATLEPWHLSPFTGTQLPAFYAQQIGR